MAGVDLLSGDLALKAQVSAMSRDYILEPRLGKITFQHSAIFVYKDFPISGLRRLFS